MNLRLTPKRKRILEVLQAHHGTLSAKDLHAEVPDIDLATIYRNLELFAKEKLIHRVYLGEDEAQYEYQDEPHHHAVCNECHRVIHFTAPDDKIKQLLGIEDFEVDKIEVTVRGICNHKK